MRELNQSQDNDSFLGLEMTDVAYMGEDVAGCYLSKGNCTFFPVSLTIKLANVLSMVARQQTKGTIATHVLKLKSEVTRNLVLKCHQSQPSPKKILKPF